MVHCSQEGEAVPPQRKNEPVGEGGRRFRKRLTGQEVGTTAWKKEEQIAEGSARPGNRRVGVTKAGSRPDSASGTLGARRKT